MSFSEVGCILLVLLLSVCAFVLVGKTAFGLHFAMTKLIHLTSASEGRRKCEKQMLQSSDAPEQIMKETPFPEVSVLQQFLQRASRSPGSMVSHSPFDVDGTVTMNALRSCAMQCAKLLAPHIDGSETSLVALYMHGGPRLTAAILGTWLAKGAWTPLDRKGPVKRLQELVKEFKPAVVLCDEDAPFRELDITLVHAKELCFEPVSEPDVETGNLLEEFEQDSIDRVAQVILTSGSTGTPKGVKFSHRRLAHSTHFFAEDCGMGENTRILQKTSNVWSVFRHEVYPALCRGALIVHAKSQMASDPMHLAEVINSEKVTLLVGHPVLLGVVGEAAGFVFADDQRC